MRLCPKSSPALGLVVLYLVLVCLHIIMSLFMKGPLIVADETGYLGSARYLVEKGVMPNMKGTAFYHAGYSILISPAFWLSSDPTRVYFIVLVINSFLITSLFPCLYYCLKNILLFNHRISVLASLVTSLYPSFLLHSNIAWAENAIIPLFILSAILFYWMVRNKSLLFGILFGISVSSLYTVHPRSLLLLPISAFYLIYLVRLGFLPLMTGSVSLITLLFNYLATVKFHGFLQASGWGSGGVPSIPHLLKTSLDLNGVAKAFFVLSGQLWYIIVSTYALWILGVLVIILKIWKNRISLKQNGSSSPAVHTLAFYLLSCGGVLSTSVLFLSHYGVSGQVLIYGRYNECFIAFGIAVGLGEILEDRLDEKFWKRLRLIMMSMFIGLSLITLGVATLNPQSELCGFNLFGLFPILGAMRYKLQLSTPMGILACALYSLIVMISLMRVFKVKQNAGIILLGSLFLMFALVQHVFLFLPGTKRVEALVLPKIIQAMPDVNTVSFDLDCRSQVQLYQYQYFLPHTRFLLFDSSKDELPKTDFFIASRFSEKSGNWGAHLVFVERGEDLGLWVKQGALRNERGM